MRAAHLFAVLACGCAPVLTAQGHGVSVYVAKTNGAPRDNQMPEGCRLLGAKAPVSMTEAEIAVQDDPYRTARNEAGAAGGNALLVRARVLEPRRSFDCPGASAPKRSGT